MANRRFSSRTLKRPSLAQACADSFSHINSFSLIFGGTSSFFLLFFQFLERERESISRERNTKQGS